MTDLRRVQFFYPIQIEEGENTFVLDHDIFGDVTLGLEPGVYLPLSVGGHTSLLEQVIDVINDALTEAYEVRYTQLGRVVFDGGDANATATFQFDDPDFTLDRRLFGANEDTSTQFIPPGSTTSPNTRLGAYEVPVLKNETNGLYNLGTNPYGFTDWRIAPEQMLSYSNQGVASNVFTHNRMNRLVLSAYNVPAALVRTEALDSSTTLGDAYSSTWTNAGGQGVNTLQTFWRRGSYWGDFRSGESCYVLFWWDNNDQIVYPARWDKGQASYNDIISDVGAGERYAIDFEFIVGPGVEL